ncbi:hypothetical protein L484_015120 [Morus notabilis]|uniref:Uncharacterized protein n=1 Tax=Morus notabilis TaxID=981085 RepID=W9S6W8_9ROSA|nr:hypothetical protein L484_015120 [Morus notabilis]
MKPSYFLSLLVDSHSRRSCFCSLIPAASLLCLVYFIGSAFIAPDYKEKLSLWGVTDTLQNFKLNKCKNQCRPSGSEALPEGIVCKTSNLEFRPLWGSPKKIESSSVNLFAVAVGIKQKDLVNKMVRKFLSSNFVVMLFHYDGNVDKWKTFEWSDRVIHVSAVNQTKWWFAKRFLHPDIVAEYDYIFLWDEDLGVDSFDPKLYISIVQSEGLEISQPALDPVKSVELHHQITARGRRSTVHRRTYKHGKGCDENSKAPPCTGWIEMMAPVFSRAAWRCAWFMIQGDRTKSVGVVDAEYVVHHGRSTLGGGDGNKTKSSAKNRIYGRKNITSMEISPPLHSHSHSHPKDHRAAVRRQSYIELDIFKKRWVKAVQEDKCWVDPYQ